MQQPAAGEAGGAAAVAGGAAGVAATGGPAEAPAEAPACTTRTMLAATLRGRGAWEEWSRPMPPRLPGGLPATGAAKIMVDSIWGWRWPEDGGRDGCALSFRRHFDGRLQRHARTAG